MRRRGESGPVPLAGDAADALRAKRLLFTVTTGRSGTGHLARLLAALPRVSSHHEPEPSFASVMREVQGRPDRGRRFWIEAKLPAIRRDAAPIYSESSHLFCKGFAEPLFELGLVPDLILLTRPHRDVAKSLLQLDTIPGRTEKGLRYLLSPEDPGVLPVPGWAELNDYQLCFWYCLEIRRRQREYAQRFAEYGSRIVWTSLEELRTRRGIAMLVDALALPRPRFHYQLRYALRARRPINPKRRRKRGFAFADDLDSLEESVRCRAGWEAPDVPAHSEMRSCN